MRLLLKNQFYKIKGNIQYFISISLIILIVSISFTAFKSSVLRLGDNYDAYLQEQNVEDFYMLMGEVDVSFLGGTAIVELCNTYDLQEVCSDSILNLDDPNIVNHLNAELGKAISENPDPYESLIDIYIRQFEQRYDLEVEKQLALDVYQDDFIFKFRSLTYDVDIPYIVDGVYPFQDNEIMMYPEFMEYHNLEIGDTYVIDGVEMTITGSFYAPDYILPLFSTNQIQYDETKQTLLLANQDTIRKFDKKLVVKYTTSGDLSLLFNDFDYESVYNQNYSTLGREMQLIDLLVPRELNYRITALEDEVSLAHTFINLFLGLFIGLTSVLLLIFMKKYIDKNRKDIEILHAMGYSKKELTLSLMVFPFVVSMMSIVGYVIGLLLSNRLFLIYSSRYYYPKSGFILDPMVFVVVVILPIIFILLVNYLYIQFKIVPKKEKRFRSILPFTKFTPLKTLLISGFIFLVISILLLFGLNSGSLFDSFSETTLLGNNYEKFVMLNSFTNDEYSEEYQSFTRIKSRITHINTQELDSEYGTYLYGIDPDNDLKLLIQNDLEKNLLLEEGIIISEFLKEHANLRVGDELTFTIGSEIVKLEIVGISNELIENNMFIKKEVLNESFQLDNEYYNGLYLTDDEYDSPNVYRRVNYHKALEELVIIFNTSSLILNFVTALSVALAIYVFIIMMITYLDDNLYNIATLKAIGYNSVEILKKYFGIIALLLALSYLIAIPITSYLFDVFVHMLIETMGFKFIISMSLPQILLGFGILVVLFGIVIFISDIYFNKANISLLLKKEEK